MDVSANVLRKETIATLKSIEAVIEAIEQEQGKSYSCTPEELKDHQGNSVLAPLLLGKAQCLNTLVLLRENKES